MTSISRRDLLATTATCALAGLAAPLCSQTLVKPPVARAQPVTDDYFGTRVTDNYRWMENPKDSEWAPWLKAQADHARAVLDAIPGRRALLTRVGALSGDTANTRSVQPAGGRLFLEQRPVGAANYQLLLREADGRTRVLIDPTVMKEDGAPVALNWWAASPDGRYVCYGLSAAGSENAVGRVLVVDSGEILPERLDKVQYAQPSWLPDGSGFFYNQLTGALGAQDYYKNSQARLHRLRTSAASDPVIMQRGRDPGVTVNEIEFPGVATAPGSDVALLGLYAGVQREVTLYTAPLADVLAGKARWRKVCAPEDKVTGATFSKRDLYLLSNKRAVRGEVLRVDALAPDLAHATVAAPEAAMVYENLSAARDGVYLAVMDGGVQRLSRLTPNGQITPVPMPFDGGMQGPFTATDVDGAWFEYAGWVNPSDVYHYDPAAARVAATGINPKPAIDLSPYATFRITATARDGTKVPVSVVARRDLKHDGSAPCLVNAYGSYQISQTPGFQPRNLAFLDMGGVFATAHVRGGGEYGREWWLAGKGANKPNTWRDLIACCEALVRERITSPGKLGILGGSAGGITMGMALTERPDLFAAVFSLVGVSNALRAEQGQNGPPNVPEFGTARDREQARALIAMDALSHVKDGVRYPAVMLTTGATDPRVDPWHAGKMAARLQAASVSGRPVLLRVQYDAGHGLGSTRQQRDAEVADMFAFLLWQSGDKRFQLSRA